LDQKKKESMAPDISIMRNKEAGVEIQVEVDPDVRDFYTTYNPNQVFPSDQKEYEAYLKNLTEEEKKLINESPYFYELGIKNKGGLVMPLILRFDFTDGTNQLVRIPAEIWKMSEPTVTKVFRFSKPVAGVVMDPYLETADVDVNNNQWPAKIQPTRFELFKQQQNWKQENPMQKALKAKE
jgi:hypothetical protein